jgi:hypothetical protein
MMSLLTELDSFCDRNLQRCQSYGLEKSVFIRVHPWLKIQILGVFGHFTWLPCHFACLQRRGANMHSLGTNLHRHDANLQSRRTNMQRHGAYLHRHGTNMHGHGAYLLGR